MARQDSPEIEVWDPFVRIAHWVIALGFFVAYLTEDEAMTVHVWAGYIVGVLVVLRIVWGFVGAQHARFADFVCAPQTALRYLWGLLSGTAPRYLGHSPAGGAMVVALLLFLASTVATGLVVYAEEEGAGPLAPFYTQVAVSQPEANEGEGTRERREESTFKEVHEVIANITLGLVVFHILGVVLASFAHHENLAKAMITGRKRKE